MKLHTRKVNRPGRPEEIIDSETVDQYMLMHGRNVWLRLENLEPVAFFWDIYERKFLSWDQFRACREARAQANRRKHSLVPFGQMARKKRADEDGLSSLTLGWVGP